MKPYSIIATPNDTTVTIFMESDDGVHTFVSDFSLVVPAILDEQGQEISPAFVIAEKKLLDQALSPLLIATELAWGEADKREKSAESNPFQSMLQKVELAPTQEVLQQANQDVEQIVS